MLSRLATRLSIVPRPATAVRSALVCVLATVIMTGCGFHLRGKTELSSSLQTLSVEGSDVALRQAVEDALRFSGATIVDAGAGSTSVLELTLEDYERRVRTVDSRGLATSYYLEYRVNFRVRDGAGDTVIERKNLRQRRDFDFDSTQVLQKEGEERFLREDMQRDLAQTILRLLATVASVQPSPQTSSVQMATLSARRIPAAG